MTTCPKCLCPLPGPGAPCPKCGLVFTRQTPEHGRVPAAQIVVSTTSVSEPFTVLAPVFALTTSRHGQLEAAARELGIHLRTPRETEVLGALFLGDAAATFEAIPVAWMVCIEQLKRQAAGIGGDAVIGVQMVFDADRSVPGLSHFTMHVYGTVIRRRTG